MCIALDILNMDRREMKRSDWKRITKRKYASRGISYNGINGVAGLILIEEISAPLSKNGVKIVGENYKWIQIALENQNFWITAMFDENDGFIQIYFDITLRNYFDEPDNPKFDDLFVDLVLTSDLDIQILDEDELNQAFAEGVISCDEFNLANKTASELRDYISKNKTELIEFCYGKMTELKKILP